MITLQAVVEIHIHDNFDLWPIAELKPFDLLRLDGTLDQKHVGIAVMSIAAANVAREDDAERTGDSRAAFVDGLLTEEFPIAFGGLRIVDTVSNTVFNPGCCHGLEEWRDWFRSFDGGPVWFGHDPSSMVERDGRTMRLTVDAEEENSRVIELPVDELRRLLAQAERDLGDFLMLARSWATGHLPEQVSDFTIAMAKALNVATPTTD
ncbi:hypothetical protein [Stackebrandtia soli]|uniref:hypothetical protein n=1 Tax=Stackebrandtia soli TaxID=1892856 RepID=UPI0039E96F48